MMKYFCCLSFILCSFQLSAATLDVEIQGITDGGALHLAVYNSKEVFESDRGDKPGSQTGIEAGVVKKIGKGTYKGSFEIPPGTYAIGVYIDELPNCYLRQIQLLTQQKMLGVVLSDRTLSLGINMPFKSVSLVKRGDTEFSDMESFQMMGRCGRRNLEPEGSAGS